jgi:hypothetical protein
MMHLLQYHKMINKQFPTAYDVEQAINFRGTPIEGLRRFLQGTGLLTEGEGKNSISKFAQNILFEHQDYICLRKLAQGASNATNISGFILNSKLVPIQLDDLKYPFRWVKTRSDK